MIVAGNNIYEKCGKCHKLVKINKAIFGSLHVCRDMPHLTNKEYADAINAKNAQESQWRKS